MSFISKPMLRQTSTLYRASYLNVYKKIVAPLSTSSRHFAEATNAQTPKTESVRKETKEYESFDSIPVHLGKLSKLVMVLGGLHKRYSDVPDTIPNRIYQKTKDKFRARCVIFSIFGTGLLAFVAATRGKKAREEGKKYTDDVFNMHIGTSRLHDQLGATYKQRKPSERYSPLVDEINK